MQRIVRHGVQSWFLIALFMPAIVGGAEPVRLVVQADRPGAEISPTMYGVFFEDINFGADGGLYAEFVKNRSFEFPVEMTGWTEVQDGGATGSLVVRDQEAAHPAQPHYLRIAAKIIGEGYGIENSGFAGMGVRDGEAYDFSVYGRAVSPDAGALRVQLIGQQGNVLASAQLGPLPSEWSRQSVKLVPNATDAKARLRVLLQSPGTVDVDLVSLLPQATWKNRPGGLRADLVQWLADLKPGFLRFPGGCIVEGRDLSKRYQWKNTIGLPQERRLLINRWNDEFAHRPAPDYFQSFGLGFYEYFLLSEDLGAQPLPIVNCGMACQFNTGELVALDELDPYIQDALDLIEFANGPVTSTWGGRRAAMGHPEPFNLQFLGIGNEQWGPEYIERYTRFAQVLKSQHPDVQLVSSAGPRPADELFRFAWPKLRQLKADIVDEHCYDQPAWFLDSAARYDDYDRSGPKVFMGEYAAQSVRIASPNNRNNWECALAEAAFIIGLERNADIVVMSSYAPLFGHEELWQWRPNLIWFDNLRSYGTPNYYVQQLFSCHRGDRLLPVRVSGQPTPSSQQPGLYVTASEKGDPGEIILKVVNSASTPVKAEIQIAGHEIQTKATTTVLAGKVLRDENSLEEPTKVAPVTALLQVPGSTFPHEFPPSSLTVLHLLSAD